MPLDHKMTHDDLRDLDIRRGKASMDWYRTARALYRGEATREDVDRAETKVRELDAELRRAIESQ
jgi:hypothetical protein